MQTQQILIFRKSVGKRKFIMEVIRTFCEEVSSFAFPHCDDKLNCKGIFFGTVVVYIQSGVLSCIFAGLQIKLIC